MRYSQLNRLQSQNQRKLRRLLYETSLIKMVRIGRADGIDVESLDWGDYWRDCQLFAPEIELLHQAWVDLIVDRYKPARFDRYVWAYFTLLKACTARIVQDQADLHLLRKVIGLMR